MQLPGHGGPVDSADQASKGRLLRKLGTSVWMWARFDRLRDGPIVGQGEFFETAQMI